MLDRLRGRLDSNLTRVGHVFARIAPSPTVWTLVGLAASFLAAFAYSPSGYFGGLFGGVLVLVSGWFDIIDGAVAKVTGRTSKRGAFLDSTLHRLAEVVLFVGILEGAYAPALTVVIALSLSLLVSYTRAKGDALGVALSGVGVGERSERLLILAVFSISGFTGWGVLVVAVVALYTFLERIVTALRTLSQVSEPKHI